MGSILSPEFTTLLTLLLYTLAGCFGIGAMIFNKAGFARLSSFAAILGFSLQTIVLATGYHSRVGLSAGVYLQLLAWCLVLCGLGLKRFLAQDAPLSFASLLALLLYGFSAPSLHVMAQMPQSLHSSFYAIHVGSLFLSIALIIFGGAAGIAFVCVENRIKRKLRLPRFLREMPALNMLDKVNAFATLVGFPLFTIGMISGLFQAERLFGGTVTGDPKQVISLILWLLFAVNFHNRLAKGWHGRKPARLLLCVAGLCLFSVLVVNLFMTSRHAFI